MTCTHSNCEPGKLAFIIVIETDRDPTVVSPM